MVAFRYENETRILRETTSIPEVFARTSPPPPPLSPECSRSLYKIPLISNCLLLSASSLRCYRCQSRKSWEHCDGNTTEIDCNFTDATCVKYSYEKKDLNSDNRETMFARGCLPQSQCSGSLLPACKDLQKSGDKIKATCNVSCCGEDICNSQVMLNPAVLCLLVMYLIHAFFVKVSLRSAKWKRFSLDAYIPLHDILVV